MSRFFAPLLALTFAMPGLAFAYGEPDEDGPCKRRHPHASRPRLLTVAV